MTFQEEADQIYPHWKEKLDPAHEERNRGRLMAVSIERDGEAVHLVLPRG